MWPFARGYRLDMEEVSGFSPLGFFMLAFFEFGVPGHISFPSMSSPRCILSVLSDLPGAFGLWSGSLTDNKVIDLGTILWRAGGVYRACNLTCAMTRLTIPPPSQNTTEQIPPPNTGRSKS